MQMSKTYQSDPIPLARQAFWGRVSTAGKAMPTEVAVEGKRTLR